MTISCPRCQKLMNPPAGAAQVGCPYCGQVVTLTAEQPVAAPDPVVSFLSRSSSSTPRRPSAADGAVPLLVGIVLLNLALTIGCAVMLGLWEVRFQRFTQGMKEASDNFNREMKKMERDLKKVP